MVRNFIALCATFLFSAIASAANTLVMPSPADGFPTGWNKMAKVTCTQKSGPPLIIAIYIKPEEGDTFDKIWEFARSDRVLVRHHAKIQNALIVDVRSTIIHSGKIEDFTPNAPGSLDNMRAAILAALKVSREEYLACLHVAEAK